MDAPAAMDPALQAVARASLEGCPQAVALGLAGVRLGPDGAGLRLPWRADLVGDAETAALAGGAVATLLDHVGGQAVWAAAGRYIPIATLDLRIDRLRPARPRADVQARAHCYRLTAAVGFVRAVAYEDDPDDPLAAAQGAYVLTGAAAGRAA